MSAQQRRNWLTTMIRLWLSLTAAAVVVVIIEAFISLK